MIRIVDSGIVYCNPAPDLRAIHAALPFVGNVSDKELLCVYRRGTAFGSADGNIATSRSPDGGKTWSDEGFIWDRRSDDRHYEYRGGGFTRLEDGTLLLAAVRFERPDPDKPIWNSQTGGYMPVQTVLFRSADQGITWSEPQVVPLPPGVVGNFSHGVRRVNPHRLLIPIETWKAYDVPNPVQQKVIGLFSSDGGKTWPEHPTIADGVAENRYYWDVRVLPLGNDHLMAFFWTHDAKTDQDLSIHQAISTDGGATWSKPRPIGIEGQVCNVEDTGRGRILMAYNRRYAEQPGVVAILSTDESGLTWDLENPVMVWDARQGTNVGVRSGEGVLADMATYAFGYPCVVRLQEDEFLICFWATQACVTHIRWGRIRLV